MDSRSLIKQRGICCLLLAGVLLLFLPSFGNTKSGTTACNADFTFQLDDSGNIPVYTFTANETDSSKTFTWNIGGSQERTGRQIKHIFFDAGGWMVTLTVSDESDTCSTNQQVDVTLASQAPTGSCFFNIWKSDTNANTYAIETYLPWYYPDMSYKLDFGDGSSLEHTPELGVPITHTYSAPGTYQVCQTMNEDSCTYCKEILVDDPISEECDAGFTYTIDSTSTDNWIYTFKANDPDSTKDFFWNFEMQSWAVGREVQHIFTEGKNWEVSLRVANGDDVCNNTQTISAPTPRGCFVNITRSATGNTFDMFPFAEPVDNSVTLDYTIGFGDGTVINERKAGGGFLRPITYTYIEEGIKTISLSVIDGNGATPPCLAFKEVNVILPECEISFDYHPTDSSNHLTYSFVPTENNSFYDYSWEVDGQLISNDQSHEYTFPDFGTYQVSLSLVNESKREACKVSKTVNIIDPLACDASFTYTIDSTSTDNWIYTFTSNETDTTKTLVWAFEDAGHLDHGREVTHIFTNSDSTTVIHYVNDGGRECINFQKIRAPAPSGCFMNLGVINLDVANVIAVHPWADNIAGPVYYSLDMGDGTVYSQEQENGDSISAIVHRYRTEGVKTICLNVTDSAAYSCQTCEEVNVVLPAFEQSFTITQIDSTNQFLYRFTPENLTGLYNYRWQINGVDVSDDWLTFSEASLDYTFPEPGNYEVQLYRLSTDETVYMNSENVVIEDSLLNCDAGFTYKIDSTSTENWIYTFTADETDESKTFIWNFRQGLAFGRLVEYIFTGEAILNVELQVSNEQDTCITSKIIETPNLNGCALNLSKFDENTIYVFPGTETVSGTLYYNIDYGDGTVISREKTGGGTFLPLTHSYREAGRFNVCLSATDSASFSCEVCEEVEIVLPSCPASFVYHQDSVDSFRYIFTPLEISGLYSYKWSVNGEFLTDQLPSDNPFFEYTFPATEVWDVSLYMMNVSSGDVCVSTQQIVIESDSITCPTSFVYHLVDSANTYRYLFTPLVIDSQKSFLWEIEGGFESTDLLLDYTFPDAGFWNVTLNQIENGDTCSTTQTIAIMPGNLYISGLLFADLIPVDRGTISLYKQESTEWKHVLNTNSVNGAFSFSNLAPGRYLLHARGDVFIHQAFIPTYFVNGIDWQDAYELELTGSAEEVKITLIRSQALSVGQGRLEGRIVANATEEPYIVLLKDRISRRTVKWTMSGQDHAFNFDQLPFGQYRLTVERPSHSFSQNIDLTESQAIISGIELRSGVILGNNELLTGRLDIYPTMVEDQVFLRNNTYTGRNLNVELRSVSGQLMMSRALEIDSGETVELSLPPLEKGIYLMQTIDNKGQSTVTKLIR